MKLSVHPDYQSVSRATADLIAEYIRSKEKSLVCLASGHSPRGVFSCLIEDVRSDKLRLDGCTFVSLDEWAGIPANRKGSCRAMMDEDLFGPLSISESHIRFFDGMSKDPEGEAKDMNAFIHSYGGLDIMLVGVGTNGHIAMNEPGTSFEESAHISTLAEETKIVGQKYFDDATELSRGITLGLKNFRQAKLPILIANGEKKASIIQRILSSSATESIPATIVHLMDHAYVMLDAEAYKLVTPA